MLLPKYFLSYIKIFMNKSLNFTTLTTLFHSELYLNNFIIETYVIQNIILCNNTNSTNHMNKTKTFSSRTTVPFSAWSSTRVNNYCISRTRL